MSYVRFLSSFLINFATNSSDFLVPAAPWFDELWKLSDYPHAAASRA